MPEVKLSAEEAQALRMALGVLVVRTRTGELGSCTARIDSYRQTAA